LAYQHIIVEKKKQVAWVTINHPERHNSFDHATVGELLDAFTEIGHDSAVGVAVLTGAGDKSFCAGGYLADLANFSFNEARKLFDLGQATMNAMRRIPQPVIAAVNGFALGGGNELVICSDLAIASEHARFGQTGPRVGSSPIMGGTNLLALTLGEKKAREVVYMCRQYTAQEAFELGWINKVVPHEQLHAEVEAWCEELLDKSPAYLELSKISSNVWWDSLTPSIESGKQALLRLAGGREMTEGTTAFMEKRKPNFRQFRS